MRIQRNWYLVLFLSSFAATQLGAQDQRSHDQRINRQSLRGVTGIQVRIQPNAVRDSLGYSDSRLRAEVEQRLRDAQVPVIRGDSVLTDPNHAVLNVIMNVRNEGNSMVSFFSEVEVLQKASLVRDSAVALPSVMTWSSGGFFGVLGMNPSELLDVRIQHMVGKEIASFTLAYWARDRIGTR